jgi:hypothetical protein
VYAVNNVVQQQTTNIQFRVILENIRQNRVSTSSHQFTGKNWLNNLPNHRKGTPTQKARKIQQVATFL